MNKELPIGFMDSGLGGLSVLREAVRIMPAEDFIYFGDPGPDFCRSRESYEAGYQGTGCCL